MWHGGRFARFRRPRPPHVLGSCSVLVRLLVLVLSLSIATSGALPLWALLIGVEAAHVCRCSIEKHDCVCAKCNPDQDEMRVSGESLSGRCGDDDMAFGGKAIAALPSAPMMIVEDPPAPIDVEVQAAEPVVLPPRAPPKPPPRRTSSRTV